MLSITTKFLGPTNYRGARVSATVSDYGSDGELAARKDGRGGRLIVDWNHAVGGDENHRLAMALAKRLGWDGEWVGGESPSQRGYTYVRNLGHAPRFTIEV